MKKTLIALAVVGAASMLAANATQWATPVPGSFYVGLQAGWGHASLNNHFNWHGSKNQFVGGIYGGYQFTPYFAVELGSQYFSNLKHTTDNITRKIEVMPYLTLAAKGDIPIFNNFDAFGEVGGAIVRSEVKASGPGLYVSTNKTRFAPLLELGLEYAITPNISMRLADQVLINAMDTDGAKNTENSVLVGIAYRFGDQNTEQSISSSESSMHSHEMHQKTMQSTTTTNVGVQHQQSMSQPSQVTVKAVPYTAQPITLGSGMTVRNTDKLSGAMFQNTRGVIVTSVQPGSLAYDLGLKPNDVIIKMDNYRVSNVQQLAQLSRIPQKMTTVTVIRGITGQIVKLENHHFNIAGQTLFGFNSATLTNSGKATLNTILNKIKASGMDNPTYLVAGYTDPIGTATYNLGLSQRRAQSVANYLVSNGIPTQDIHAVGYGETHLIVTQDQYKTQAQKGESLIDFLAPDRRVTIDVEATVNETSQAVTTNNVVAEL